MTFAIEKNDFKEDALYSSNTVGYLLEEMKTRLSNNIFLLAIKSDVQIEGEEDNPSVEIPYIALDRTGSIQSSLGDYLDNIKSNTPFTDNFTIASVINVGTHHYISATFRQEHDFQTLVIHDPLGEPGKTAGYKIYEDKIYEEFKKKFGEGIVLEINPKNSVIYQSDVNSCGVVCLQNLEYSLNNKKLKESPQLGITKDVNSEFRCEENAISLRKYQLKKLQKLQKSEEIVEHFMGGQKDITPSQLIENIFNDKQYDANSRNKLLNSLLDAQMIEGKSLTKHQIVNAIQNGGKKQAISTSIDNSNDITTQSTHYAIKKRNTGKGRSL